MKPYDLIQGPLYSLTILLALLAGPQVGAQTKSFNFHIISEPESFDPVRASGASGNFLLNNIYRALFRYSDEASLIPEGAESCSWKTPKKLTCLLNKDRKWPDGLPILAEDYVRGWKFILDPKSKSRHSSLLLSIQGVKSLLKGDSNSKTLGIRALDSYVLEIDFEVEDREFLFKTIHPALSPRHPKTKEDQGFKGFYSSGPYQIAEIIKGQRIKLIPNPQYPNSKDRPPVEILLIDEDSTALTLYEMKKLNFLRRVVTDQIPVLQKRSDFFQIPMARFDYIGFRSDPAMPKDLRKALALALNYDELKSLYFALGRPGCPSLPSAWIDQPGCYPFDPKLAKKTFNQLPEKIRKQKLVLGFSRLGGEDISKGMEWAQAQWKKHLGIEVELQSVENAMFLQTLKTEPQNLFRKGFPLDRPTCLAALENFHRSEPENYIKFKSSKFETLLKDLKTKAAGSAEYRKLCKDGVQLLMDDFSLIPLGEIHFSMMAHPGFSGWKVNSLNQLDLTDLRRD